MSLPGGIQYPFYRLVLIGVGLAVAVGLGLLINRTRIGIRIRAAHHMTWILLKTGVKSRSASPVC